MRPIVVLLVLFTLMLVTGSASAEDKIFGKGVSAVADTVLVSHLLSHPDAFADQVVRVSGTAVGVCGHRGCWVSLTSDVEGETIRVKVKDGEIVFPPEIVGEQVVAEGVFTINTLDMETTKRVCAHRAKSAGEDFDPASVTECMTVYQISGTGALVENWDETSGGDGGEGHDAGDEAGHSNDG